MPQAPDEQASRRLALATQEAFRAGRLDQAEELCKQAIELWPQDPQARLALGVIRARKGDLTAAISAFKDVIDLDPNSYEAHISLATAYRDSGNIDQALAAGLRAASLRPDDAYAHYQFGTTWIAARRPDRALVAFRRAVDIQPDFAPAHEAMGLQYHREGKYGDAAISLEKAATLAPSVDNLVLLAKVLQRTSEFDRSEFFARQAVCLSENSASAHVVLASALFGQKKFEEGEGHIERAKELDVTGGEAFEIAYALRNAGNITDSNASLRKAIQFDPNNVHPYALLMHNVKVTEEDRPLIEQMRILSQGSRVSPVEKAGLHYGLGKALEDLGEYEESMFHYDEANRFTLATKLNNQPFDEQGFSKRIDMIINATPPELFTQPLEGRSDSELPILIVGMARSGTTLAEQILSSHPLVEAAGEHPFWTSNWLRARSDSKDSFVPEEIALLGQEYIKVLSKFGPAAARVTDKMPANGLVAGLIHLALPNARLIHMRRSPIDNGLSIWKTPNIAVVDGSHEKRGVVYVFKDYLRLMDHWRAVLPPDRFLEVDYEELVYEPERVTREMVAFCGLEWDDECLKPEANIRSVVTPSTWQVRQPVYKTSVERWRKFEPWLGELRGLLELKQPPKRSSGLS